MLKYLVWSTTVKYHGMRIMHSEEGSQGCLKLLNQVTVVGENWYMVR